jgi:hypothetical protein
VEFKLNDAQIKDIVGEAILTQLDEETRATLIKEAIAYLVTKQTSRGYGHEDTSPLQDAYRRAVGQAANVVCKEMVNDYLPQIEEVVRGALDKVFSDAMRGELVEKVAEGITSVFWNLQHPKE